MGGLFLMSRKHVELVLKGNFRDREGVLDLDGGSQGRGVVCKGARS